MPKSKQYLDDLLESNKKNAGSYKVGDDQKSHEFFISRKRELLEGRKNVLGVNLENLWKAADTAYVPHELKIGGGKKVLVSDDELGWRSQPVILGRTDDWQENSAPTNPYVKVQTALALMVDRNPEAVFKALVSRYEASNNLHAELYKRNWDFAQSKQMLKVMVLNGAKYGVLAMHTAPLKVEHKVRDIVGINKDGSNKYEETVAQVYDDVYRWALDPWECWFDDMARPGDRFSMNDWQRRKDYSWEKFVERFEDFPNFKYIQPKKISQGDEEEEGDSAPKIQQKHVVRLWFYENLARDMFYVEDDQGIVLINEPIPAQPKNKMLSCSVAPWTLRSDKTVYGIGVYEAMRNNYKVYLKYRNMTIDQCLLSIYKEWFYAGTQTLQGTGEMKIKPGSGRQVTNPKDIVWSNVPGPGKDAWTGMDYFESKMDDDTGISKTLEGELSPRAKAFDIAQAREAALKRMKTPLDNIAYVLEQDAYRSVAIFEELYSIPEIEKITEPDQIEAYKAQIAGGEIEGVGPENIEEETDKESGETTALNVKRYREFPLNIERDNEGNLVSIQEEKFFQVKPDDLPWRGKISITGQSIIAESPLLEKQNKLELANLLIPLFEIQPQIVEPAARQLLMIYKEEPEDWYPKPWLEYLENPEMAEQPPEEEDAPLFVPKGQGGSTPPTSGQGARKVVPSTELRGGGVKSTVGRLLSKLNPFKKPGA